MRLFIFMLFLFIGRIIFGVYLWQKGDGFFVLLRGDDVSRVIQGYIGVDSSFFDFFSSMISSPLAPWLYAQGLKIYPNLFLTPSVINTIFGLGGIIVLFFLTRELFGFNGSNKGNMVGLLSVGIAIFYPAFVWATLASDRHSILLFFILTGLFFWVSYMRRRRRILLLFSAFAFMFSTSTMNQPWIYVFVFVIFILKEIIVTYKRFKKIDFFLIGCILIASSWIFQHLYLSYNRYGNSLGYVISKHHISGGWISLMEVTRSHISLLSKIFIFPILQLIWPRTRLIGYPLMVERITFYIFLAGLIILTIQLKKKKKKEAFNYFVFIISVLVVTIITKVAFIRSYVNLPRYLLVDFFCFIPFLSFILYEIISKVIVRRDFVQFTIIIIIITIFSWVNILASVHPPKSQMRKQTMQLGILLRSLWHNRNMSEKDLVLMEERVEADNFSLAIEPYMFQIFNPDNIKYDREWKPIINKEGIMICDTSDNPSLFEMSINSLQNYLRENNFRIVIVRTEGAKEKVSKIMEHTATIGEYNIYIFPQDKHLGKHIREKSKELPAPWLGRETGEEPKG